MVFDCFWLDLKKKDSRKIKDVLGTIGEIDFLRILLLILLGDCGIII